MASFIGTSVKRSDIRNFILYHQIDFLFIVETWLKGVGDEAMIADLTPSGYFTRSFLGQAEVEVLLSLPGLMYCLILLSNPPSVLNITCSNCFKQHYQQQEGLSAFSVSTDLHLIARINLLIPCLLNNCGHFSNTAIPLQVVY